VAAVNVAVVTVNNMLNMFFKFTGSAILKFLKLTDSQKSI